ncbi:hypothetical protein LIER_43189 [Lithospermum erythrorhizon]|uniref:Uncharacterized protein n=1 Tax=Lithospermum erythrorhizon TaxID=34254 RepID=A0AAV3PPK0_LITER
MNPKPNPQFLKLPRQNPHNGSRIPQIFLQLQMVGVGNLEILPLVSIVCPIEGCTISVNLSGSINVGQNAAVVASTVIFSATSLTMEPNSLINTTALGGSPPSQSTGTPVNYEGAGG